MDFFSAIEAVADFPANWKIGRVKAGASAVSRPLSVVVVSDVVAAFAVVGVPGALFPRVAAARIAAWAMIIASGMGAVAAFDRVDEDVSSVSGGVSVVETEPVVVAAGFATGVVIALIPRVARNADGGTFVGSWLVARSEAPSGVVSGVGTAGIVTVGAGVTGVVVSEVAATWVDRAAQAATPGLAGATFSCSCCKWSAKVAEGSSGAGATAVADEPVPVDDEVGGRKPSDVLPEYAFMVSSFCLRRGGPACRGPGALPRVVVWNRTDRSLRSPGRSDWPPSRRSRPAC